MTMQEKKILVCGIGNTLLQDEGVGVHVIRELKRRSFPSFVEFLEAGVSLLDFIFQLREAERLILLDAMKADGPPGSVYLIDGHELIQDSSDQPLSLHQVGAIEVLRIMSLDGTPPPCLVVGIEPASLDWGLELSSLLQSKMCQIVEAVEEEIRKLVPHPEDLSP